MIPLYIAQVKVTAVVPKLTQTYLGGVLGMGDAVALKVRGTEIELVVLTQRSFTVTSECFEKLGVQVKSKNMLVAKVSTSPPWIDAMPLMIHMLAFVLQSPPWLPFESVHEQKLLVSPFPPSSVLLCVRVGSQTDAFMRLFAPSLAPPADIERVQSWWVRALDRPIHTR